MRETSTHHFFWNGPFSNWYPSPFEIRDHEFVTSEHAFMWLKALEFGDSESAELILRAGSPEEAKYRGRHVKNYDDNHWSSVRYERMLECLRAKFSQNPELKKELLDAAHLIIVEASPFDTIWGIGLHETDDRCLDESLWQGENLLGDALNQVAVELA